MRKRTKDSPFKLLQSLKLIKYFLLLAGLLVGCNNANVEVSEILDGNTVRLSNGSTINLIDVVNNNDNVLWLKNNLKGASVTLLDKKKLLIEDYDAGSTDVYIFTDEGINVNKTLSGNRREAKLRKELSSNSTNNVVPLTELYTQYQSAVFLVYTSDNQNTHQGTGFFISPDGIAVSNYHVFEYASKQSTLIKTNDGIEYKVEKVLAYSREKDFIVLKIAGLYGITKFFPIASITPAVGTTVFTIGNPKGLESTLSTGIISSIRENGNLIQTTTEITHGSSGGPLINMEGEVIGITTAGIGEANLNFAVNINLVGLDDILERK